MVPRSDWARAVTEKKRRLEITSTARRQETAAAIDLLDLGAGPLTAIRDLVKRRAAITGKPPIPDIRGLSQKKTAVGPCYAPLLLDLEGVYPVFTPGDLTG